MTSRYHTLSAWHLETLQNVLLALLLPKFLGSFKLVLSGTLALVRLGDLDVLVGAQTIDNAHVDVDGEQLKQLLRDVPHLNPC